MTIEEFVAKVAHERGWPLNFEHFDTSEVLVWLRSFSKLVRERAAFHHKDCHHNQNMWRLTPHDFGKAFDEISEELGLEEE